MSEPDDPLPQLAGLLRADDSVVSPHVTDPAGLATPLGDLAAAGPRTAPRGGEYAFVVETVREGYLLHYPEAGGPRVVRGADRDLSLLAGDYLYAVGLERLAGVGDLAAVRELSDLISLAAQVHDGSRDPERRVAEAAALWLASAAAIAAGSSASHERSKTALRSGDQGAVASLWAAAVEIATIGGFSHALGESAAGLDFRFDHLSSLG